MISNTLLRVKFKFKGILNAKEKKFNNRLMLDINDGVRLNWSLNGQ